MPEKKGLIKGFDYDAFAKDLSSQAIDLVPQDIADADRKFVSDVVFKFCLMAGEALSKDETIQLDVNQASLITQFIGEWSFHKAIDLIHGNVADANLRESILQKVAFTVFEIAKTAVIKKMPQEQLIPLVENHVKKSFEAALNDLVKSGVLDEKISEQAKKQSNVDTIAQAQVVEETPYLNMSDYKKIKLASLAYLMRSFSKEKIQKIISKFDKPEASVLVQYLNMENLENSLNLTDAAFCLVDMKHHLPPAQNLSYDRCYLQLCKIVKNSEKNKISTIIEKERPVIKDFALSPYSNKTVSISARIADIICQYLKEKIA